MMCRAGKRCPAAQRRLPLCVPCRRTSDHEPIPTPPSPGSRFPLLDGRTTTRRHGSDRAPVLHTREEVEPQLGEVPTLFPNRGYDGELLLTAVDCATAPAGDGRTSADMVGRPFLILILRRLRVRPPAHCKTAVQGRSETNWRRFGNAPPAFRASSRPTVFEGAGRRFS